VGYSWGLLHPSTEGLFAMTMVGDCLLTSPMLYLEIWILAG
jgi:hypothetical protein